MNQGVKRIAKTARFGGIDIVTFIVGPTRKPFHVYKDVLYEASSYFERNLNSRLEEGGIQQMDLPNDEVRAFEVLVSWLYGYEIVDPEDFEENPIDVIDDLFHAFVMADDYNISGLKNKIVDEICNAVLNDDIDWLDKQSVDYLFDHTSEESGMRRLLVDILTLRILREWFSEEGVKEMLRLHSDVAAELAISFAAGLDGIGAQSKAAKLFSSASSYYDEDDLEAGPEGIVRGGLPRV